VLLKAWIRLAVAIAAGIAVVLAGVHVGLDVGGGGHPASPSTTMGSPSTVVRASVSTVTVTRVRTRVVTEPPTGHGIHIAYGAFAGKVRIVGAQWHPYDRTIGAARVDMQAEYTGKAGCRAVRSLGVAATLFDSAGRIAETSSTDVFALARGVRTPITIRFFSRTAHGRIELVVTKLSC
jgi:hypothetical protein